jgi:TetR/AcrR family transcriptional regulator, mexJK operon transcriptional repressor
MTKTVGRRSVAKTTSTREGDGVTLTAPAPSEKIYSRLGPDLRPRSLRKYRAILEAASRMFIAQGFGPTSMDAVADAARVSKRTVYDHFENKHTLFTAVIETLCAEIVPPSVEQLAVDDPRIETVLESLGNQFLKGIYSHKQIELFRTVVTDARTFPELGRLMFDGPIKHSEYVIADYFRRQAAAGKIKVSTPELAAAQFMGMLKTNLHVKLLMKPGARAAQREIGEIAKASVELFLRGALRR